MSATIMPFFSFYGGKWRVSKSYQYPQYSTVIEPFAGSAGYSVRNFSRNVMLYDKDPVVIGTWQYLINATKEEIRSLPLIKEHQTIDEQNIPQEAKWLIGWWLNKGSAAPGHTPSRWMRDGIRPNSYWGPVIRERIASSLCLIRHWSASVGDYQDAPDIKATWFIDPPYVDAGRNYRFGSKNINYGNLADWCLTRTGQAIVCENAGADWLPFREFRKIKGSPGEGRTGMSKEVVWYSNAGSMMDADFKSQVENTA